MCLCLLYNAILTLVEEDVPIDLPQWILVSCILKVKIEFQFVQV